ncbi:sulfite reductase subunit alpha [Brevundimonas goettingensis]|uniref:NADPH--hemoprotein reductase n=1 Tax=Brevundimonas goettingensis TaxID=2774190 RepID=A0A975GVH6_9CAUL|nr:sulfite reductase subunit alpha [Brevundimonas goettingensis]QTC91436.1 flavodoxin domain-containing protein [Brevundimonas goettingensis]
MTTDPVHWIAAAVATGLWLIVCAAVAVASARARRADRARTEAFGGGGSDATLIAYASQTGFAEELALMTARALTEAGQSARVVSFADLERDMLTATKRALFVVATTGEGDAPDSAGRVLRRMLDRDAALPDLTYGMLALGDRSYKDYCGFAHVVDGWLRRSGATPLFDLVEVDDADPEAIRHWQHQLNAITGSNAEPDWTPPSYDRWTLVERRLLNPGSPGGEAFHLAFAPVEHTPDWSAGDIVEIGVPAPEGDRPAAREYSIASLPADGRLELLVRLMRHPDGTPGLASGWLTGQANLGDEVAMRVRVNRGFHGPAATTSMILIGNGTGLAGLRGHLKARASGNAKVGEAWLMFGERTSAHDAFHDVELQTWLASGVLTRLDRTFSRDPGDGRYVQAVIAEQAEELRRWIDRGAAIYVCGSLEGMASGVHAALEEALGPDRLITLAETGRYRRDVY